MSTAGALVGGAIYIVVDVVRMLLLFSPFLVQGGFYFSDAGPLNANTKPGVGSEVFLLVFWFVVLGGSAAIVGFVGLRKQAAIRFWPPVG